MDDNLGEKPKQHFSLIKALKGENQKHHSSVYDNAVSKTIELANKISKKEAPVQL